MRFIDGLKGVLKTPIYAFVLISFILCWFLVLFGNILIPIESYLRFVVIYAFVLIGFNIMLIIISFFKRIKDMRILILILLFLASLVIFLIFTNLILLFLPAFAIFLIISLFANQFVTAFFAFKMCMDSATKIDDYFYKKEKSRTFTRIIEFLIFGILAWWLLRATGTFFYNIKPESAMIFLIIFWLNFVLLGIVLIRLIAIRKFAAYITLFFLLTFFYILYIIIDILYEVLFPDTANFQWYIFFVDLFLFLYIIGSIYSRIDYIEQKLKILKPDTIALFLIVMKLYVQITKIFPKIPGVEIPPSINQETGLLLIFLLFTFLFGIHSIFSHKFKRNN